MKAALTDFTEPGPPDTGPLAAHLITPYEIAAITRLLTHAPLLPRHRVFLTYLSSIPDIVPPLITERQRARLVVLAWRYQTS